MIPCLYKETETAFTTNGIGKLCDALSCLVTEKRNGAYELKMEYPSFGIHAEDVIEGNIILDVSGEEKKHLTRQELVDKFAALAGTPIESDQVLLSK